MQREAEREHNKAEQCQALLQIAKHGVQGAGGQQLKEHRLAHRLGDDGQPGSGLAAGQQVGAVPGQSSLRLRGRQAGGGNGKAVTRQACVSADD